MTHPNPEPDRRKVLNDAPTRRTSGPLYITLPDPLNTLWFGFATGIMSLILLIISPFFIPFLDLPYDRLIRLGAYLFLAVTLLFLLLPNNRKFASGLLLSNLPMAYPLSCLSHLQG